jgi:hypothetical protein
MLLHKVSARMEGGHVLATVFSGHPNQTMANAGTLYLQPAEWISLATVMGNTTCKDRVTIEETPEVAALWQRPCTVEVDAYREGNGVTVL